MGLHLTGFQWLELALFAVIIVRQEMIHMADETQLEQVNDGLTSIEADEATIAGDLGTLIEELKTAQGAGTPVDLSSVISRLASLHVKLQGDNATAVAAETPAAPATPTA